MSDQNNVCGSIKKEHTSILVLIISAEHLNDYLSLNIM